MTIVAQITHDLKSRIQGGRCSNALTLAALSKHYGVSFTPVRAAVDQLVRQRYLRKDANGRLQISASPARRPAATRPPDALAAGESRQALVTREVIRRSLLGAADYLREEATAQRFRIGRTAIRQLFSRLAGNGLLEHVPRCGWRVRGFSAADLRAYLEIREILELKALDLARPRLIEADLQRMLAGNPPTGGRRTPRLDNQLHAYLIEKSRNRYIAEFFEQQGLYYTTLFDHAAPEARVVAEMAEQHREILQALIDGKWLRARRALSRHIRSQKPVIEKLLQQLRSEPARSA